MNISIEATPKEIAALVLELQERRACSNIGQNIQAIDEELGARARAQNGANGECDANYNIIEIPGATEHSGTVRVWFEMASPDWCLFQESAAWKSFLKDLALAQKR